MKKRIEKLTKEQEAKFPDYVKKWKDIGLSTQPANRLQAEEGIRKMYGIAGLKAPHIVWCDSPLSMSLTRSIVQKHGKEIKRDLAGDSVRDSVRDSVWASVRDSVWDSVCASVSGSVRDSVCASVSGSVRDSVCASVSDRVWDSIGDSIGDSVWDSVLGSVRDSVWGSVLVRVRDSVRDSVWASVRDSVWDSVCASVSGSVRDSVLDRGYGQHDANWVGFYDYFRTELGLIDETEKLAGLDTVTRNAGWYLPHENICWISERHGVVMQDDQGRLHCENGPSVMYPDGFSIYSWHGTTIPKEWIEDKENLTPAIALKESNLEKRRAACEIIGWAKIVRELGGKTIDKDPDPQIGELIEVDLPDAGKERFLFVQCGTKREFALCVPPDMKTALAANAWTYFLKPTQYKPEIRT